jgi:lipopolysaccharide/colanic/teichoic acid biosynthesis glycosyltransferase
MIHNNKNLRYPLEINKISGGQIFWTSKRTFDIIISILLLPLTIIIYVFLLFLNKHFNPGPVFFIQERMGKDCVCFKAIKFRTMHASKEIKRGHNDPVEENRVTPLGSILRKSRIDEIPQIFNVLKGEMSLIGPRPDYYKHAIIFLQEIDGYQFRHAVRPGISGLSQIRLGYAVGIKATRSKTVVDKYYIKNASFLLELKILFGTIMTLIRRTGM